MPIRDCFFLIHICTLNPMQQIRFDSVEEFLNYLPEYERKITEKLRYLLLESIPECRERLAYNVPYFYRHTRICFIWPSSIPWGNVKLNGVQLGFCRGDLLNDDLNYLEKGNRKEVYVKSFHDVREIDSRIIRSYVIDAVEADDLYFKGKKRKRL